MSSYHKDILINAVVRLVAIIIVVFAIGAVGQSLISNARNQNLGGVSDSTVRFSDIGVTGTSGAMLLAQNVSAQVLATSSVREAAKIANVSSFPIFCNANADKAAVAFSGIMISASSTLHIDNTFPYTGAIRCISPYGTASTSVYSGR